MLTESLIQMRQNPLVVINSHLGGSVIPWRSARQMILLDQQEI